MPSPAPFADPDPLRARERGLHRVSSATRWTATAAAAGALVLGAGYAHAATSGTSGSPAAPARHAQPAPPADDGGTGDDGGFTLQPPVQAPQPVQQGPQTTTGAS